MSETPRRVIKGFSQPMGEPDHSATTMIVAVEGNGISILCSVLISTDDYDRLLAAERTWHEAWKAMEPQP